MIDVYSQYNHKIWIGDGTDCNLGTEELAVVHATKVCHQKALKYKGSLSSIHPNYLALRNDLDLYLNLIDAPVPLFKIESFKIFMKFMKEMLPERDVLIHCNNARSRAPSLAMILWKTLKGYSGDYDFIKLKFLELYPDYDPGAGIESFMKSHWEEL